MAIQKITKNVLNAELQDLSNVDSTALGAGEDGYVVSWDNTNTQFTYVAPGLTTVTFADIDAGSVLVAGETFDNQDDQLMSAAAIEDYVTSQGFISSETDPVYSAAPASGITSTNITNWNAAYDWGDHSTAGYLTSYTETDPEFAASEAANITSTDTGNWDTAFEWGNHASAGYLTSESDTFATVTGRGATTTTDITVEGRVTTDELALPSLPEHPDHEEGLVFYDEIHKTLNYYSDIDNIIHEIGIEEHQRVFNNTGSTIPKGAPLYFSGNYTAGTIDVPTVALADGTSSTAYNCQGLAAGDIANNSYGYCIVSGQIDELDTSGLTAGQNFFLGLTPGALQNAPPSYPNYPMCLGWVVTSDATNGVLLVNQQNHSVNSFRVQGSTHIGANLQVDGNLTVLGSQVIASSTNISIGGAFNYFNSGDTIGEANTTFSGTGLDDAFFAGHYNGTAASTDFYVRIDATGTPDTFEWSLDNFSTTEATGVAITGDEQVLQNNIKIKFSTTTGHTVGDTWSGTAAPTNVDTGWASNRNTGTTGVGYTHLGSFFDATDEKFRFFSAYDPEPEGTIDITDASYQVGTIVANIEGDLTGNADTATVLSASRNFSITGAVTASNVGFTGAGDVTLTATMNSALGDLTDVSATAPGDGQILAYNNTTSLWEPANPATGGGTDTLDTVTDRGASTTNLITTGGIDVNGPIRELTRVAAALSGSQSISATLGTIQHIVLSGNVTFTNGLQNGDSVTFMIDDGTGFTVTWPTMEWIGGSAPTLDTTNETVVQVWRINNALYGAFIGYIGVGTGGGGQPTGLSDSLLQISGENDAWTTRNVDISAYANETVRLVFRFVNTQGGFASDMQIDNIQLDGTTYSFENQAHAFQTSNADDEADYTQVSWTNLSVQEDARGLWQVDQGGTPSNNTGRSDADAGNYYVYAETSSPADATGYTIWLRSPEVTLDGSPTLQFAEARTGADMGQLDVYLEVI